LAAALRSGELAPAALLAELAERIARRESELLALVPEEGRFERLADDARALEQRFPDPESRPALYGVPVGVKDIFRVDGLETRAGSRLPPAEFAGAESAAVSRLKAAGALVLGKTVSTEFAYFAPGPTRNPHDPSRTPGGSSSGSAAAVAAGLCPLALGTQTIGSITRPASFCGVVGFKPSYDRVSRAGVVPLAPSADHVGLFTADAAGARLAAAVLCDQWREELGERRPVLAIPTGPYLDEVDDGGRVLFAAACERLAAAGYLVRELPAMPDFATLRSRHDRLVAAEAATVHAAWLERFRELYHSKTIELVERGRSVTAEELTRARASRLALRRALVERMEEAGVDLWISPAARGVAPEGLASTGDPVMNLPWTHAGLPTLALPAAVSAEGLPFGLQIAAGWWQDEALLAWGEGIERDLARGSSA
jgi:Asp-tRNA(Asn)/Glu-tRNA(Gln) amidotransferase A subunit family amidase